MRTAYTVQPLARHLPEPERETPTFRTVEEYAAAMRADAKKTRQLTQAMCLRDIENKPVPDKDIIALLRKRPGLTSLQIAEHFGRGKHAFCTRMSSMEYRGQVTVQWIKAEHNNSKIRSFYAAKVQPKNPRGKPPRRREGTAREKVFEYIRDNPGCTTHDIAKLFGQTNKGANNRVRDAIKGGFPIRSETYGGNKPARYWVEVAQ